MRAARLGMIAAGGSSSAWSPLSLGSLLWSLWQPSDAATLTLVSGAASQLDDKSGNGRHVTQGTAGNRPTTTTINGLTALSFAPTQFLARTGVSIGSPMTVGVILQLTGGAAARRAVGGSSSWAIGATAGNIWTAQGAPSSVTLDNNVHVAVATHDGTTVRLRLDGTEISTGTPSWSSTEVVIGALTAAGASPWNGAVGDVVIASAALAGADLANLETWLKTRAGI